MRTFAQHAMMIVSLAMLGSYALAQEVITTPSPAGGAANNGHVSASASDQAHSAPATDAAAHQNANRWRYRWENGRWWYWTPQNRWLWYSDDGQWIPYDSNHAPQAVEQSNDRGVYDNSSYTGYGPGYRPGVAVGVSPYGDVGVGVGRRVGVDVCGPHGAVRVGRIYVGW